MARKNILYLHIGTHKTGTTSIQTYMWNNRRALNQKGVDYPDVGLSGPTHANFVNYQDFPRREMAIKCLKPNFDWKDSPYKAGHGERIDELICQLKRHVEQSNCSKFVMSSECFYEWTEPEKFSEKFQTIFDEIRIVVYLRPQLDWLRSVYNQLVKDSYFKYAGSVLELPQVQLLEYYEILKQWEHAFGQNSVLARPYFSDTKYDVVSDFLNVIGVNLESKGLSPPGSVFENRRIPTKYIEMLKEINDYPISEGNRDLLVQLLQNLQLNIESDDNIGSNIDVQALAKAVDIDNTELFNYFFEGRNPWPEFNGTETLSS